ncbi:MAG: DUF2147 domain-containing protein [Bacteroidota bacterium]
MSSKTIVLIAFLAVFGLSTQAQTADAVVGEWYTTDQRGKVEIYPCSNAYCGKIVWLKEPTNPDGSVIVDAENPDESLRNRPIEGIEILSGLEYDGDGEYEDGKIYDPESGKTYSCLMRLKNGGSELEVRGFIGFSLIGRSEQWTRVN